MRNLLVLLAASLLATALPVSGPALASPPAESGGGGEDEGRQGNRFLTLFGRQSEEDATAEAEAAEDDDPRAFTMPTVVAPLSSHGHLTGYAYVQIRVRVASGQNMWNVREDAHYALDAAVRAAYRHQVSNDEGTALDNARAIAVWEAALREHYGANAIERVEIRNADLRLFRR